MKDYQGVGLHGEQRGAVERLAYLTRVEKEERVKEGDICCLSDKLAIFFRRGTRTVAQGTNFRIFVHGGPDSSLQSP